MLLQHKSKKERGDRTNELLKAVGIEDQANKSQDSFQEDNNKGWQ
ncbi:MAG: hypothetical protein R2771_08355 [Saprospiraceae bacterium]